LRLVNTLRWRTTACAALGLLAVCAYSVSGQTATAKSQQGAGPAQLANAAPYREFTDETGRLVRVPQTVERIVSLAPSLTETVYALGLQDRLVGDTDYCDYPPEAQKKTKVGGALNPSIEEVASLHPDVVLVTKNLNRFETVRALDDLKIPAYATDPHTIEDVMNSTVKLAVVLGATQAGATLAGELEERLAELQRRVGDLPARRVLFVVWTEPLITVGKNTFIADALRKAGAISIVDTAQDWPQISLEEVVRLQPEFLIVAAHDSASAPADLEALTARPGWRSLEAVRNRRFAVVSDAVNRPAPRIVSAIEELARKLHPEAFPETSPSPPSKEKDKPEKDKPVPEANPPGSARNSLALRRAAVVSEVYSCNR
jgi:iron complex transport system substrate-binding protein